MKWWLLILLTAGLTKTSAEPSKYLELLKSKPVEVNGLEFVATTQAQWVAKVGGSRLPIEVQLLITNRSGHDLVFRTFDAFCPILRNAEGTEIPMVGGRDATMRSPSVLIHAGDTYCLSRNAELSWNKSGPDPYTFLYLDGTGTEDSFEPLKPGHYSLSFSTESSGKDAARESQKLGVPVWAGKAETKAVPFEIIEE